MENTLLQPVEIEFKNLHYTVKKKGTDEKAILHGVNGQFHCGSLTAILGPSGAGKTSLLNILSGFSNNGVAGSIKVNGKERTMEGFRKLSCYIPQDFDMFPQLTTKETIMYAADFKLGSGVSKHEKKLLVNKILEVVGLTKSEKTSVGKLSGGEKKRLSIGVELITNPPVMFFDEPTSGLDSSSSLQVISHLRSLARGGRTVVCTIHQPSSRLFEMFDDLYILSEGQCLYNGPINAMTTVFEEAGFQCPEHYNRADFALEIATQRRDENIGKLIAKYSNGNQFISSDMYKEIKNDAVSFPSRKISCLRSSTQYKTSAWLQFYILVRRSMLCTIRDVYTTRVRVLTHLLVGFILGALCYKVGNDATKIYTNVAYVFFFLMFLFFINPVLTVLTFPMEAVIVGREHLNSWYTLSSYYFSKLIAELPIQSTTEVLALLTEWYFALINKVRKWHIHRGLIAYTERAFSIMAIKWRDDRNRFSVDLIIKNELFAYFNLDSHTSTWMTIILCPTLFMATSYFLSDQPFEAPRILRLWSMCILLAILGQLIGYVFGAAFGAQLGVYLVGALQNPMVLLSGFLVRLRDIPDYLEWVTTVSYYRYGFQAAMQSIYGFNRTNLKCSQPYCRFKSPQNILEEFDIKSDTYNTDMMTLVIWILAFQVILYIVLMFKLRISH